MKNFYILENWGIVHRYPVNPYQAPEQVKVYVNGDVYGHPSFKDGENITTSSIVEVDPDTQVVVTKTGSYYKLGAVAPDYEAAYPDAKERFFKKTITPSPSKMSE